MYTCILYSFTRGSSQATITNCYSDMKLKEIPLDHLYSKLKKPLVIGHMGNIINFQENSLEGIKSLIDIKADGVHMQVQLTKDEKLVVFGEENLYRMTGEDFNVLDLPYSEISKMNLLKNIDYGSGTTKMTKSYKSTAKIPLLETVLSELQGKNLLIYIELVPGYAPPRGPLDREIADRLAEKISELIEKLKLENDVFVVSRDAFKLKFLNYYNPNIAIGWWLDAKMFDPLKASAIKFEYHDILDVYPPQCFKDQSSTTFAKFLLTSGIVSKAVNASFVDFSFDIYNDDKYYKQTDNLEIKDIIKKKNGPTTLGSFSVFSKHESTKKATNEEDVKFINAALKKGVTRFISNDVNRVKTALNEVITVYSTATLLQNYFMHGIIILLFGKAIVSILFV